jgi:hypothetical protein
VQAETAEDWRYVTKSRGRQAGGIEAYDGSGGHGKIHLGIGLLENHRAECSEHEEQHMRPCGDGGCGDQGNHTRI